jgi:hypothetical protein
MSMSATATRTNTYSEARLKAVMPEIGADFFALAAAGLISATTASSWTEDLKFMMQNQVVRGFQIQLRRSGAPDMAVDFRVSSDGTIKESSTSGGIDYHSLPEGTRVSLFVSIDWNAKNIAAVSKYMQNHGWGTNGSAVSGDPVRDRAYSNNGYGVIRGRIGAW